MKNAVFWHAKPCGSSKNRRFAGTYRLYNQVTGIGELRPTLAVTGTRRRLPILVTLMMEAVRSSETSVLT
jgi:hypothetical protein